MKQRQSGEIKYLTFESLDNFEFVSNLFSTRIGGVSQGYHAEMNLGFSNGDDPEKVYENYSRIAGVLGINTDHIIRSHQTHTTNVLTVTEEHLYSDGVLHDPPMNDIDGLITDVPGLCLTTTYADCVPLYFVDPKRRAIGLSHSGWKGTVNRMGAVTIEKMVSQYGCCPSDIYVAIGPSICQDCYEIGTDVAEKFIEAFGDDRYLKAGKEIGKYHLDLWSVNRDICIEAGVSPEHIELPDICTCHNYDLLFSHRASKGKRGNLAAFLMINE